MTRLACSLKRRWRGPSYVISGLLPDTPGINAAVLECVFPKLPAQVIVIEQAIAALGKSGRVVYSIPSVC
jgi:hypothetical protein